MNRFAYFLLSCWGIWTSSSSVAWSQILTVTSGQVLQITRGTTVTVNGGMLNRGMLDNAGVLAVSSHWHNEGNYQGAGKVLFNGAEPQQIDHRQQPFAVLQVAGGGSKELLSRLVVTDSLILVEGIVEANSTATHLVRLTEEAAVAGGSELSYVDGAMAYAGTGYRYFPVGNSSRFLPLELLQVQGTDPVMQVKVQEPNLNAVPGEQLVEVSTARYWEVIPLEGTYSGSAVSLTVAGDEGFEELVGVVVAAAAEPGGTFNNVGQQALTGTAEQGTVSSRQASVLPYFALGLTTEFSLENEVEIPTAFAPDADDPRNRVLKVFAHDVTPRQFIFKIFNRWGNVVYQTTSFEEALNQGWDGINQQTGQPAEFGVYTYFLQALFANNTPVEKTGTITLFR